MKSSNHSHIEGQEAGANASRIEPCRHSEKVPAIPDHELLRRIGEGSYGEVWIARNMMGAYRAIKIVHRKSFTSARPFERELSGLRQFEPISRSHEGFVDVLQVGISQQKDCFYYVMELGDDENSGQLINPERYSPKTLAKQIPGCQKPSYQECLKLGLALSQAIGELHERGLVHRDIKPSNIIFVNGVPKLADIGLVAQVNEARSYVGTQGFIPPEGPGTAQADVYSLGKVLYELSTGRDRQDFPELPTDLDAAPDQEGYVELNEVILKACRDDVGTRYQSAREMHADLVVLENGKSVRRLRLLERRLTALKRLGGASTLVLLAAGAISYQVYREWRIGADSRQRQIGANTAYGNRAMESGDYLGALPYYAAVVRLDGNDRVATNRDRLRFGSTLAQCPKIVQVWAGLQEVYAAEFSPDGRNLLTIERHNKARVFDIETARPISPRFGQDGILWRGGFSPDGSCVVTACEDNTACVWRVNDGDRVLRLVHPDAVLSASFSPDGRQILTSCVDAAARLWNAHTGECTFLLKEHTRDLLFAAFSADGSLIVTTSRDNTARIWDTATGRRIGPPLVHPTWVGYAVFSPDSHQLVTACFDHRARIWEVQTGKEVLPDMPHPDGVNTACFSPDGRTILTACLDGTVRLWSAYDHRPSARNPVLRHSARVTHAVFDPDGHRIASTCFDGTVRIWDLAAETMAPTQISGAFSADGSRYATVKSGTLQIHETVAGQLSKESIVPTFIPRDAKLNFNGHLVAAVSTPLTNQGGVFESIEVRDVESGLRSGHIMIVSNQFQNVALSDSGKYLMVQGDSEVTIWSVSAGEQLTCLTWPNGPIQGCILSPDGEKIAAWSTNNLVRVWESTSARELFPPLRHPFPITHVEFSPDNSRLVTCGADQGFTECYAQVWDATTGRPCGSRLKHTDGVLFAAWSLDGRRIATAGEDFVALVWDITSGRRLAPALKHQDQVRMCAFSHDGNTVVTASADHTARLWNADTGDPLTPPLPHLVSLAGANFTSNDLAVITWDRNRDIYLWSLPVDTRPVHDLIELGSLLTGGIAADDVSSSQSGSFVSAWKHLHPEYPSTFQVSASELQVWHDLQAKECESQHAWFAASFHLRRLISLRPGDQVLINRHASATLHLKDGN